MLLAADSSWTSVDWSVPCCVKAVMTTRHGGVSSRPFNSFNLGDHVGDDPVSVHANRQKLAATLHAQPVFLKQVHGIHTEHLHPHTPHGIVADACVTQHRGLVCTVMVADCLPVLLVDAAGCTVAAAHAGWRGLAGAGQADRQNILTSTFEKICHLSPLAKDACAIEINKTVARSCVAWLGPCIGPKVFEVGQEVRESFMGGGLPESAVAACFESIPGKAGKYRAHLAALARLQLEQLGIRQIQGNDGSDDWCTVTQSSRWFSHRRDAGSLGSTGRMAACVWLEDC